jgi:putative chitinase
MPAFNDSSALLLKTSIDAGITSPAELSNIMGNASVETWGFTTMDEKFTYRTVDQVVAAVSSADTRFTRDQIQAAIDSHDPKQVATMMYENRPEIGNTQPGDGWKYHGRGYFQYTGEDNYKTYGDKFGVDLVNHPEKAADPETAAKLAVAFWKDNVPENKRDDARAAGKIINGGSNGAEARVTASEQWAQTITPALVSDIQSGKITLEQLGKMGEPTVLREGMHGDAVKHAEDELHTLGYLKTNPDSSFGSKTEHAVEAFQKAEGLPIDGKIGPNTQKALDGAVRDKQISDVTSGLPSLCEFSDPSHPQNPLYNTLRDGFPPGTSPELLSQATAACYMSGIRQPDDLGNVTCTNGRIYFDTESLLARPAQLDINQQSPSVQQTMNQVHQFDQQQAQIQGQVQQANQQANQQQQGQVPGGPQMGGY